MFAKWNNILTFILSSVNDNASVTLISTYFHLVSILPCNNESLIRLTVFSAKNDPDLPAILHKQHFPISLVTHSATNIDFRGERAASVVLVLDELLKIDFILSRVRRDHNTIFIVLSSNGENMHKLFKNFWNHRLISTFVFFNATLHGFEPGDQAIFVKEKKKVEAVSVFNIHGANVKVSVVNQPPSVLLTNDRSTAEGVEGPLMVELARAFNMTPHFAVPRDGELWGWTTPHPVGVVGEVSSGYSEFGCGQLAITYDRSQALNQVVGYSQMECITWAVPKGAKHRGVIWMKILLSEFGTVTWFGIGVCAIVVVLASLHVDHLTLRETIFRLFIYSLGHSFGKWPIQKPSMLLITTWIWATFVLSVAYTGSMGSKLAVPSRFPDIEYFQDLLDSDLNIISHHNTLKLVSCDIFLIQAIVNRSIHLHEPVEDVMERMITNRDNAFMRPRSTLRYANVYNSRLLENIHLMEDCAMTYYPSISVRKLSPFYRGTVIITRRLFESGIIGLWEKNMMFAWPYITRLKTVLNLRDLIGAFILLGTGLAISVMGCIIEVSLHPRAKSTPKTASRGRLQRLSFYQRHLVKPRTPVDS